MTTRWLSEHRRLLSATIGPVLLVAIALAALVPQPKLPSGFMNDGPTSFCNPGK